MEETLDLCRLMLECAERGDWGAVTGHELDRRERLERYFSAAPALGGSAAAGLAEAIREIVAIDQRIIALGQVRRNEIVASLRAIENGRRGAAAYRQGRR
jgi:hypothetical protein